MPYLASITNKIIELDSIVCQKNIFVIAYKTDFLKYKQALTYYQQIKAFGFFV